MEAKCNSPTDRVVVVALQQPRVEGLEQIDTSQLVYTADEMHGAGNDNGDALLQPFIVALILPSLAT